MVVAFLSLIDFKEEGEKRVLLGLDFEFQTFRYLMTSSYNVGKRFSCQIIPDNICGLCYIDKGKFGFEVYKIVPYFLSCC